MDTSLMLRVFVIFSRTIYFAVGQGMCDVTAGLCYWKVGEATWVDAIDICLRADRVLFTPHTQATWETFLADFPPTADVWLSLHDMTSEGFPEWHGPEAPPYDFKPVYSNGVDDDCFYAKNGNLRWIATGCTTDNKTVICQSPLVSTPDSLAKSSFTATNPATLSFSTQEQHTDTEETTAASPILSTADGPNAPHLTDVTREIGTKPPEVSPSFPVSPSLPVASSGAPWITEQTATVSIVTGGEWGEFPAMVECPPPPQIPHGDLYITGHHVGDIATYHCRGGHSLTEGGNVRTIVCLPTARWSAVVSGCQAIRCSAILDKAGSVVVPASVSRVNTVITCDFGRYSSSMVTKAMQCVDRGARGIWSDRDTTCHNNNCKPMTYLPSATLTYEASASEHYLTAVCDRGRRFPKGEKLHSLICPGNDVWPDSYQCQLEVCPSLSVPQFGELSTTMATYGTIVQASCIHGYHFRNGGVAMTLTCLEGGSWSDTPTDCILVRCPSPPPKEYFNAAMVTDAEAADFLWGSTVTYFCGEKQRFQDGRTAHTIPCMLDGTWNSEADSCEDGRCPPVIKLGDSIPDTNKATEGTVVSYRCPTGFAYDDGSDVILAHCNGSHWNVTSKPCIRIQCPPLVTISHGTVYQRGRSIGSESDVICDPGYRADDVMTFTMQCLDNGQWDKANVLCLPIDCGPLPSVQNASSILPPNTQFGTIVTCKCFEGHWFSRGQFQVNTTCSTDGMWTPAAVSCKPVQCLPLPKWDHIELVSGSARLFGASVNYTCAENAAFEDGSTHQGAVCGSHGQWLPPIEACKVLAADSLRLPLTEAPHSRTVAMICLCVVIVLAAIIVISDIPTYCAQLQWVRNKPSATRGVPLSQRVEVSR